MELSEVIKELIPVWGREVIATPHVFIPLMEKDAFGGNRQMFDIFNEILHLGYTYNLLRLFGDYEWETKLANYEKNLCYQLNSNFDEHLIKFVFHSIARGIGLLNEPNRNNPLGDFDGLQIDEAIKRVIASEGKDVVLDLRLLYILDDNHAFIDDSQAKQVLHTMIELGYTKKLVDIGQWNKQAQSLYTQFISLQEVKKKYQKKQELISQIFQSIADGLGYR